MDAALRQEIQNLIKRVLETFTIQYTKSYLLALVRMIKEESRKEPEPWLLESRPPWKEDLKSGFLVKEGAIRKNWKKRWFAVRPNYTVDYFESEAESKKPKGKKKGTMQLAGYSVVTDPNQGILVRLKRLAEKMGMDFENLPKPKEYPPLVFELYHSRRRCYYIQAKDKEEFDDWCAQFRTICWRAYGLTVDEYCHKIAFPEAIRKTRWELGRWGWYSGYGSEEQILTDLISDELEYEIMGRIYSKLVGPWVVRSMLSKQVQKALDTMIGAAVKPAWGAMKKAVEELRPKVEPKIRELVQPIFEAEQNVIDKMREGVMSVLNPILEEHVCPHLGKIVEIIKSPMVEAFDISIKLWCEKIDKWEPQDDLPKSFRELDWFPRSYWEMRDATDKTDQMYEPLWALHLIFKDIYPWSLIWTAHDELRNVTDNAVYSWEHALEKLKGVGVGVSKIEGEKAKEEVLERFRHDAGVAKVRYYKNILKKIVMPPFEALVHPACKLIIEPIAELIPQPLREFIDIKQDFEDLYNGIVDDVINTIVCSDEIAPAKGLPTNGLGVSITVTTTTTTPTAETSTPTPAPAPEPAPTPAPVVAPATPVPVPVAPVVQTPYKTTEEIFVDGATVTIQSNASAAHHLGVDQSGHAHLDDGSGHSIRWKVIYRGEEGDKNTHVISLQTTHDAVKNRHDLTENGFLGFEDGGIVTNTGTGPTSWFKVESYGDRVFGLKLIHHSSGDAHLAIHEGKLAISNDHTHGKWLVTRIH